MKKEVKDRIEQDTKEMIKKIKEIEEIRRKGGNVIKVIKTNEKDPKKKYGYVEID